MTTEPVAAGGTVTCPDCGRLSPADRVLCECGYPLEFEQRRAAVRQAPSVTRAPGDRDDDDTAELPAVVDDEPPPSIVTRTWAPPPVTAARGVTCPACGEVNPPERTWCARCGGRLRAEPAAALPPAPAPPERRSAVPTVIAAIVAVVLLASLGLLVWRIADRGSVPQTPQTTTPTVTATADPGTQAPGEPQELAAERVTVTASSTQTDQCSCAPELLLDGDVATAWNHDGLGTDDPEGVAPEGVTLTFTFDGPVHVVGVAVVNGYVKTTPRGEDLFAANHRVAEARLSGESLSAAVTFGDIRERQEVGADLGVTSRVTLEIRSTHPGTRYPDVALSEVRFLVAP